MEVWFPHRVICIDETMTRNTSGRCPVRQNIPSKPIKWGTKSFTAVDGRGVILYSEVYRGRRRDGDRHKHLAVDVVHSVLQNLRGSKGHLIVGDNWYGHFKSMSLCKEHGCNSLWMMRVPKVSSNQALLAKRPIMLLAQVITKKSERGARLTAYCQDWATLTLWRDNKVIGILTDEYDDTEIKRVIRRKKGRSKDILPCPESVEKYNLYKSLVDRDNQKKSEIDLIFRARRWQIRNYWDGPWAYVKINAWRAMIVEKGASAASTFADFCLATAVELAGPLKVRRYVTKNASPLKPVDSHIHAPEKSDKRSRCAHCKSNSMTAIVCISCKVPLHLRKCFVAFHNSNK